MDTGVRTIISCPCCEKIFIENCRYEHRKRADFKQFRKYLNLTLTRRNTGLMTKGTHMKLDERDIPGPDEIPHIVSKNKDRKSLLYQAQFIADKKRENCLRNEVCASRNLNKYQRKRENLHRNWELKNDLVITKYDQDLEKLYQNTDINGLNAAEPGRVFERKREQMWFPNVSRELQSPKTGSAVIKFTNKNIKLDIYLPKLTLDPHTKLPHDNHINANNHI